MKIHWKSKIEPTLQLLGNFDGYQFHPCTRGDKLPDFVYLTIKGNKSIKLIWEDLLFLMIDDLVIIDIK